MSDPKTEGPPSRDSSDSDIVGFADQPYEAPPPQPESAQPEPAIATTQRDIDLEAARTQPPVQPPAQNGGRQRPSVQGSPQSALNDLLSVLAFILPWGTSVALSWSALTKVALRDAPSEVLISCIASTLELGSTLTFFGIACCYNIDVGRSPNAPKTFGHYVFHSWILFLMLDPVVTGAIVWDGANKRYSCEDGAQTPRCQVGKGLVVATGVYRTFGVLAFMFFLIWLQTLLEKRLKKTQEARGQGRN